jgi:PAS domain S-box-containing protein
MSRNQQSIWHDTRQQQDILSPTPARLELVPERSPDLENCSTETLRRTQEELQWYRRLYENIPSVYFSLDTTGIILSVNQSGANSLGYTPSELINQSIFNLFVRSDKQKLSDAFMSLLRASPKNGIANWEFRLDCPASNIVWVKVVARLLPGADGHYLPQADPTEKCPRKNPVILMVCEDITAHKQAEDALRESEQRFHTMANTAPVMMWMAGCDGLFTFFNQSWLKFTGSSIDQQQGLGWLKGVHPQEQSFCEEMYYSAFHARTKYEIEYRLKRHDGEYRWILDTGIPRFMPSGEFAGYIGCCIDITERKLAEVSLKQSQAAVQAQLEEIECLNRLKDEFLSTVSH